MATNNIVVSDFNLQKINTKEMADNLRSTIEFGGNIFICGRRGSSKTAQAKEQIKLSKCKELYLNLSVIERTEIGGFPNFFAAQHGAKYINFLMPHFYKDLIEGDTPVVALLDELDKADSSLWGSLLEFIQMRSINGYELKNLHAVVMTGNLQAEGGQRPSLPLLDRAEKFLVEINADHWLDWAARTGEIHPSITAFISDNREDLQGDVDPGDAYADCSPRGWHNASKLLFFGEKHNWHPRMMADKVAGCIGKKVGIKYSSYFEHYQVLLPYVDKIMKGEEVKEFGTFEPTRKLVICMILCQRYAKLLDEAKAKASQEEKDNNRITLSEKTKQIGASMVKFMQNKVDPEVTLISIRSQIGSDRALTHNMFEDPIWGPIFTTLLQRINGVQ